MLSLEAGIAARARYLRIYLQDHHAAAQAGLALARRALTGLRTTELEPPLKELVDLIDSDEQTLRLVLDTLGISSSRVKDALALLGERLGRLKLNGRLRRRSPLSSVLELELLVSGIAAKAALWRSLAIVQSEEEERLAQFDFELLARSADEQRQESERLRDHAWAKIFLHQQNFSNT